MNPEARPFIPATRQESLDSTLKVTEVNETLSSLEAPREDSGSSEVQDDSDIGESEIEVPEQVSPVDSPSSRSDGMTEESGSRPKRTIWPPKRLTYETPGNPSYVQSFQKTLPWEVLELSPVWV